MTIAGMITSVSVRFVGKVRRASGGKHNEYVSLGARLAISRTHAALSQQRVASYIGVARYTYMDFERGKKAIPAAALVRLQKGFGIDATLISSAQRWWGRRPICVRSRPSSRTSTDTPVWDK